MMQLKDSRSGLLERPKPIDGVIGLYLCGPTVAGKPHLGHLRTAYAYDVLVRWLRASGETVRFVQNITDIDDKILAKASELNQDWRTLAENYSRDFALMRSTFGLLEPDAQPKATEHMEEIIALIQLLLDNGAAYVAEDGSANVYYSVTQDKDFGSFTRQSLAAMESNPNISEGESKHATGKRHPLDFSLWKAHKEREPLSASWQAPWGRGRPGWHIEDTAMAVKELGERFTLHGGGRDLRLPHHESEVAQARGAAYAYAEHWVHSGLITVNGEKMAKSKGNFILAEESFKRDPSALRLLFTRTHYASDVEYSDEQYDSAKSAWNRIQLFLSKAEASRGTPLAIGDDYRLLPAEFVQAMDHDLNTPAAYAVLFDTVKKGYRALEQDSTELAAIQQEILAMLEVLGFTMKPQEQQLSPAMQGLLTRRAQARSEKDFALSDRLRDELRELGVIVRDTKAGQEVELL